MNVEVFTHQYVLAAAVYGTSVEDLRRRDESQTQPLRRWLAVEEDRCIGAVTTWLRPDDRMFLMFVCREPTAYGPLTESVAAALGRSLNAFVDADDHAAVDALTAVGFVAENVAERFRIRFDSALILLERAWVPVGFKIHTADTVDEDRLFALDNAIRHEVLGTDGWYGDRDWFAEDLAEAPPFDPTAYLVAIDDRTCQFAGLVRVWRNPTGPRLGLIGVVSKYRSKPLAAVLLKQALTAASTWGHETFTTETSPENRITYPRIRRLGAESEGQFVQLVRPVPIN